METKFKTCSKCNLDLPATSQFFWERASADCGLRGQCKKCVYKPKSRLPKKVKNPPFISKNDTGEHITLKKCIKCNSEKELYSNFMSVGKGKFRAECRGCYKKYFNRDPKKLKEIRRKQYQRIKNNPLLRLKVIYRVALINALNKNHKSGKSLELLGCSFGFLKTYLENKFKDGMTWQNHAKFGWHIDHIRPCSSFDFSDPEQQKECFHYTNLQPLWWRENLIKGDKYVVL